MRGLRVLIVEDEPLLAAAYEGMLLEAGAVVVGRTGSVAAALRVVATQTIDVACLDVQLGRENSFPVADALASRAIPFLFVTGRDAGFLPARHRHQPLLKKSSAAACLLSACLAAARRDLAVV